jgi:hypothetical protein
VFPLLAQKRSDIHTYIHTYVCIHICIFIYIHTHIHIHIYQIQNSDVCLYVHTHTHTHTHIRGWCTCSLCLRHWPRATARPQSSLRTPLPSMIDTVFFLLGKNKPCQSSLRVFDSFLFLKDSFFPLKELFTSLR